MGNCCVFQPATGAPDAVRWLKSNLLRLKQLFPSLMKQNKVNDNISNNHFKRLLLF